MQTLSLKELIQFKGIWHSVKQEHIDTVLNNNYLESRTTQRYWKDGMTYRDNQGDTYQNSHYMKGWSMTRDRNYAFSWSCVTFLFDYEAIRRDFKIKPISWNYRISSARGNFDKEREEFVVSNIVDQTFDEIKEEFFQITDRLYEEEGIDAEKAWKAENGNCFIEYWQRKGRKTICFDKYLKGIFVCKESYDIFKGRGFQSAINHPLFKGFVSRKEAKKLHSSNMKNIPHRF